MEVVKKGMQHGDLSLDAYTQVHLVSCSIKSYYTGNSLPNPIAANNQSVLEIGLHPCAVFRI
jgi:hypothetical protein